MIKSGLQRKNAPPRETKNQKAERLKCEAENSELKEKWDWGYKITNEKLRKICRAAPIGTLAKKFHLKYIAHVTRMSNSALQKQMIYCEAPRPQRRGQMNFWTKIKKATGIETEQLQKTMYNRNDFNKWMRDRYGFAPRPAKSGKPGPCRTHQSIDRGNRYYVISTFKVLPINRVAKIFIVCLHYELSFFGIFHRFTNTKATKKTLSSLLKDGAYNCYCAYVLRISRYSDFLSPMLTNTGIFLRGLKLSGESRSLI